MSIAFTRAAMLDAEEAIPAELGKQFLEVILMGPNGMRPLR
jgi:hypothetical protein